MSHYLVDELLNSFKTSYVAIIHLNKFLSPKGNVHNGIM